MTDPFLVVLFIVTATFSAARLTRLITQDSFPPAARVRAKWDDWTEGNDWNVLFRCHFCMSFWATLIITGWGFLTWRFGGDAAWLTWFFINGTMAMSYVAAMIVHRDENGE